MMEKTSICAVRYSDIFSHIGPLAHLARALPWHGRGDQFESGKVHQKNKILKK